MSQTENLYTLYLEHRSVTTDSRSVPEGALFFALKGEQFDGNRYAADALRKGASAAVIDDPGARAGGGYVLVDDSLKALQMLAVRHRREMKATVIGITGSNGKTTTKELINSVLSAKYRCQATAGNLNNHIGVPLTLLSMDEDLPFAIVEMGANHQGEIRDLSAIANPGFGLITNVGKAHLEGFGGFDGVVKAKTELYSHLRKNNGTAFVNAGNKLLVDRAEGLKVVYYGREGNPVSGNVLQSHPFLTLECLIGGTALIVETRLVGSYNLENVLAAAAIGHHFGVTAEDIKAAIEGYHPENNRSQVIRTYRNTLIMDAYNANPTSMEAAITNFAAGDYDNKALVLGEMRELGEASPTEHSKLIGLLKEYGFDDVFLVGREFRRTGASEYPVYDSADELIEQLMKLPLAGKTILIKGSRGNRLERILTYL